MSGRRGPALIEVDVETAVEVAPSSAAFVPDDFDAARGQAMRIVAALTTRRSSKLVKWFLSLLATLICLSISVAAWEFIAGLIDRAPLAGYAALALSAMLATVLAAIVVREFASFARIAFSTSCFDPPRRRWSRKISSPRGRRRDASTGCTPAEKNCAGRASGSAN